MCHFATFSCPFFCCHVVEIRPFLETRGWSFHREDANQCTSDVLLLLMEKSG